MARKWGQHFLSNADISRRIVEAAQIAASDQILEIGPGHGELTTHYIEKVQKSVLLEIDPALAGRLRQRWALPDERMAIIQADALEVDWAALGWLKPPMVLGNLPYYASKPLVMKLIEWGGFKRAVLMLQEEVARRLAAAPATSDYGLMSVLFQRRARGRLLFIVEKKEFRPPPKVQSAVILIEPRLDGEISVDRDPSWFIAVVKAAFSARRQKMTNALARRFPKISKEQILSAMRDSGIPDDKRAQEVPPENFVSLSQKLYRTTL
ncbi:MAG: ribosomal RNA small subunit methyltransferase A [Elusimicrobia bacterium]|nr:ribosomal RNA small subunit methyltransferase A [Elusimicrobiota bacterium]